MYGGTKFRKNKKKQFIKINKGQDCLRSGVGGGAYKEKEIKICQKKKKDTPEDRCRTDKGQSNNENKNNKKKKLNDKKQRDQRFKKTRN